jgi:hypothetical protein
VNCQSFYLPSIAATPTITSTHVHTAPNLWPPEALLPGFRETFEELCTITIDIGALVARACDQYASKYVQDYEPGYLEHMVKTSSTTKARLLHYFPPEPSSTPSSSPLSSPSDLSNMEKSEIDDNSDSWCASHLDDGCLTAQLPLCHFSLHPQTLPQAYISARAPLVLSKWISLPTVLLSRRAKRFN